MKRSFIPIYQLFESLFHSVAAFHEAVEQRRLEKMVHKLSKGREVIPRITAQVGVLAATCFRDGGFWALRLI